MSILDIIELKRDNKEWSSEAINRLIGYVCDSSTPDYQISALLMAIYLNGLTDREITDLTLAMARSGDFVDFGSSHDLVIDKHSTGGVGDKTSLVLMPLVAASGVKTCKLSGKGLGHTGGTLDKLSLFPGFRVDLDKQEILKAVQSIGLVITGQSAGIVPADRRLYALRDATATVDSLPLIASSIMSKKIATGAHGIMLDVKVGNGANFPNLTHAKKLAQKMVTIGHELKINTRALLTNMSTPLGKAVGNALEVKEALETLQGDGSEALRELSLELGSRMLQMAGKHESIEAAKEELIGLLDNGLALQHFKLMIKNQGGNTNLIDHTEDIKLAPLQHRVYADKSGFVNEVHAKKIGLAAMAAGAGRAEKDQSIDLGAGVLLNKKEGDEIKQNELLLTIFASDQLRLDEAIGLAKDACLISQEKKEISPLILDEIKSEF